MGTPARELKPGDLVIGRPKTVTLERMRQFSGWPSKNIHTDADVARACGLPGPIASGTMFEAYLTELMIDLFGEDWIRSGTMQLAFIRMVEPGDILVAKGRVQALEQTHAGGRLALEVWCENQRGERVTAGVASGRPGG